MSAFSPVTRSTEGGVAMMFLGTNSIFACAGRFAFRESIGERKLELGHQKNSLLTLSRFQTADCLTRQPSRLLDRLLACWPSLIE